MKKLVLTENMYFAIIVMRRIAKKRGGNDWIKLKTLTHHGANPASVIGLVSRDLAHEKLDEGSVFGSKCYKLTDDAYYGVRLDCGDAVQ